MYSICIFFRIFNIYLIHNQTKSTANTPGATLTLTNIKEIKCESANCCQDTTITATCADEESCTVECVEQEACAGLTLNINSVESFICDKSNACNGAQITITDPADDFTIDCKGYYIIRKRINVFSPINI